MRAADNPFRTVCTEALAYREPDFSWELLLRRLDDHGGRGAIRGPEGVGKSTLLRELAGRLDRRGWRVRRLRPDPDDGRRASRQLQEFVHGIGRGTALLLDGADRLGWWRWRRLLSAAGATGVLVVTTHREGRLPTLHRCRPGPEVLGALLRELDPGLDIDAAALLERHAGNLRAALRACYDHAAAAPVARG